MDRKGHVSFYANNYLYTVVFHFHDMSFEHCLEIFRKTVFEWFETRAGKAYCTRHKLRKGIDSPLLYNDIKNLTGCRSFIKMLREKKISCFYCLREYVTDYLSYSSDDIYL
jgi:hypothetical protein